MNLKKLIVTAFIAFSPAALAELNVIADLGGQNTQAIFEAVNRQNTPPAPAAAPEQGEAAMLPVITLKLSPGNVTPRALQLPGIGALFIMGDDSYSRQWLQQNAQQLSARNAAGLVVNVESLESLKSLRGLAPGLQLAPSSGSELARRLQLTHYPVLITDSGLSQEVGP
ncbi:integrating conjugative element protein [Nissabacter sp. SGAir0207]|uniref:integrating conjugative element protein n=1 Tax=Nissabacter sp. SGAir0207 TaxID=2126321 RepID=UPI0010CCF9A7|nr:integrating conjugative element protein [Nissabacter sp. SGAir0207]QCR38670.1 integrating conjugative element protein [Nissabacter sp. SGAir0207]